MNRQHFVTHCCPGSSVRIERIQQQLGIYSGGFRWKRFVRANWLLMALIACVPFILFICLDDRITRSMNSVRVDWGNAMYNTREDIQNKIFLEN